MRTLPGTRTLIALVPRSDHRVTWLAIGDSGRAAESFDDCVSMTKELL
jgi:hypothetical protein